MATAYKFHGAGNDFVVIDEFQENFNLTQQRIEELCNRHTGIGADGLILIKKTTAAAFRMVYYNSDGLEAEMCGNGARCAFAYAFSKKYCTEKSTFEASDGIHHGRIISENPAEWMVKISLTIHEHPVRMADGSFFVNTGVPHNVRISEDIQLLDVKKHGSELRHNKQLFPEGANINFVSLKNGELFIRTYERGVEDETLACGTGITASALVAHQYLGIPFPVLIHAAGGNLQVDETEGTIWLEGPAKHVFTATLP